MIKRTFIAALIVLAIVPVGQAAAAGLRIDRDAERQALVLVNRQRSARGLALLRAHPRAAEVARRHARRMRDQGAISHNRRMFGPAGRRALGNPSSLGENVGVGGSARALHEGFMDSPGHRANIVRGGFTHAGIGVFRDGDALWMVQVFLRPAPARSKAAAVAPVRPAGPPRASERPAAPASTPPSTPEPARPAVAALAALDAHRAPVASADLPVEAAAPVGPLVALGLAGAGLGILGLSGGSRPPRGSRR